MTWKRVEVEDITVGDQVTWYNGTGRPPESFGEWDYRVQKIDDEFVYTRVVKWNRGEESSDDNDLYFWKWKE